MLEIHGSFAVNNAGGMGGAVFASSSSLWFHDGMNLTDNTAYNGGGAVAMVDSSLVFEGRATISRNRATRGGGGAIYSRVGLQRSVFTL